MNYLEFIESKKTFFDRLRNNGLHKTSSGIGNSTLSTATHLINCTALTYTTETRYWFYAVLAPVIL
jgi:hypothetical protein